MLGEVGGSGDVRGLWVDSGDVWIVVMLGGGGWMEAM